MKHSKAKENFFNLFKIKYSNYKIISFTNLSSDIIIEDENGWLHKKSNYTNALNHGFNIQSIIDKDRYIQSLINQHFNNLTLLKYNGMKSKVLVEDEFGFKYTPQCYDLINGSRVTIESCAEKEKLFIFKANLKHNNFYSYDDFKYKNGKTKINIICPIHGKFEQICESHLIGHGCPKCNKIGFSKESWLKKLKNKSAFFYILKIYNNDESFVKIGITSNNVKLRYRNLKNYNYEIIKLVEGDASIIYDMEKKYLKNYKHFKYFPKLDFEGWSECFDIKCINDILNYESNDN